MYVLKDIERNNYLDIDRFARGFEIITTAKITVYDRATLFETEEEAKEVLEELKTYQTYNNLDKVVIFNDNEKEKSYE